MKCWLFLFFLFYLNNSFAAYAVTQDNGTQAATQNSSPNSSPLLLEEDEETAQIHLDAIIKSCSGATVQRIYSIIKRLNNSACPAKLKPKKMLIIGPSGVGKSTLAQGIARFIGRPCKFIKATDLLTKYQHSGCENLLREVRAVLNQHRPYVIVIDEMNCLIDGFSKDTNQDKETATALWLALDECCTREDILFIGTMNESETIPGPIETRFKNHTIKIPLPSYAARRNILLYFLRDVDHTITRKNLSELCSKTAGLSGRELEELVTQALSFAYERHSVGACITQKDMLRSLDIIRPHSNFVMQLRYVFSHKKELLAKAMPYIFPVVLSFIGFAFQYYMWRWQQQPFHEKGMLSQKKMAEDQYFLVEELAVGEISNALMYKTNIELTIANNETALKIEKLKAGTMTKEQIHNELETLLKNNKTSKDIIDKNFNEFKDFLSRIGWEKRLFNGKKS